MAQPHGERETSSDRRGPMAVTTVTALAIAATLLALAFAPGFGVSSTGTFPGRLTDETSALGPVFHPGVILSGGSNSTTTFLGGVGVYSQTSGNSLPVFAAVTWGVSGVAVENETARVQSYFVNGGVYAIGWNGSAWLIGGQRSPGNADNGSLIALSHGTVTNLTGQVARYFVGGGIWAVGWNGTSWLIGGNSSSSASLLAWDGGAVTDLSSRLVDHGLRPWIQMLLWNGAQWLVGGHGMFGLWTGPGYVDLFSSSPFQNGGVYSAAWNGTAWLVGGDGRELVSVRGQNLSYATTLPPAFDRLALMITVTTAGWFIAGKGIGPGGSFAPELAFWTGIPSAAPTDYSTALPASFAGGDVQGGVPAPEFDPHGVLLVGVGSYDAATGYGVGAIVLLDPSSI